MAEQKAAAFMSYVHSDDRYGHVTHFYERLSHEVKTVVGFEIPIFLDREDIKLGQKWQRRIEEALNEALFFIPILTPSFFNSQYCRAELRRFLERERKLGRDDLILPVYFVDAPLLNKEELRAGDDLALIISDRQRTDWRNLRHEPFTTPLVGRTLEKLAIQIRDALPQAQPRSARTASAPEPTKTQQPAASTSESGEKTVTHQPTKVEPPTCIVDPMHRGSFVTISEAMAGSEPGTRIIIRPGLYKESLVIDKPLEIIGEGKPGDVVVQATGADVILFQANMGRVTNLTLMQAGGGAWFGVDIAQGRLEIEDCNITSQSLACVAIHNGADPRLRRNRIHDGKQGGVMIYESGLGTLEDNDIFGNVFAGVEIKTGSDPTLRQNRIHGGKESGVYVYESGLGTLEDNDVFSNFHAGIEITEGGNPTLRNNRINKNGFVAIWIYENGGGTFDGNDLRDNSTGAWRVNADCEANVNRSNNQE